MLKVVGFRSPFSEACTVKALSEVSSDMTGANVLDDDLTHIWRATVGSEIIKFSFGSSRYFIMDSLFIAGHNLNSYTVTGVDGSITTTDSWQVFASDNANFDVFQIPASVQEATNLTVVSGMIETDPIAPKLTGYTTTTPGALTRLRVRFANPIPGSLTTLPAYPATIYLQRFWATYSTSGTGSLTITIRLKEGGVLKSTLNTFVLTPTAVPVGFTIDWNGALISGTVPELELEVAATGTAAITWYATRWDVGLANNPPSIYYSGRLPATLPPFYKESDQRVLSEVAVFPVQTVRTIFIRLNRTGINVTAGGGEVGRVDGGLSLDLVMKKDSWTITPQTPNEYIPMRSGSERIHVRRGYYLAEVATPPVKITTSLGTTFPLEEYAGAHRGLFWMFDSQDPSKAPFTWFFGRLDGVAPYANVYKFFTHSFRVKQLR